MSTSLYPASPIATSKKLTSLTSSYKLRAFLAILAIVLFFILYCLLVLGLGYLAYYSFTYEIISINKFTILMKIGAIAGAVMLFMFTLKFIFKLKNPKRTNRIKLVKKEQPHLWNFVNKICEETGAPRPKAIYIDPDVNAYVAYSNMWLSLFLPVKKELTIGLGLVSCLNLTEFKAVVTHEFGHFAQSSMKIGSYIISANTIIHDMIFSRDKWDDLLDQWRGADVRLSFAAWLITPIIWIIRQVLNLFYQFLNIMYSSLSREMEFNADKVAVSTTGSEAIVSALWKLDDGATNWNNTVNHAYLASQKKLFVANLYAHNELSKNRGADLQQSKLARLSEDNLGGKKYFSNSENSKVGMYASHPPNDLRENNAKRPFIEGTMDDRSPWLLFANTIDLQKQMTTLVYAEYIDKKPETVVEEAVFESFILEESKGKDLLEEYQNTFENRFLFVPDVDTLENEIAKYPTATAGNITALKSKLTDLMIPVKEIEDLIIKAQQIANGTSKEKVFSFNGEDFKKKNLQDGYEKLLAKREQFFNEDFKVWDTEFCGLHLALAKKEGKSEALKQLYIQHKVIANIYLSLVGIKNEVYNELNDLQTESDVSQSRVNGFGEKVNRLVYGMNDRLAELDKISFSPLPNIDDIDELKEAIIAGGAFKKQRGPLFEGDGFGILMGQVESAINHCQRIEQKSIGSILLFQKNMLSQ